MIMGQLLPRCTGKRYVVGDKPRATTLQSTGLAEYRRPGVYDFNNHNIDMPVRGWFTHPSLSWGRGAFGWLLLIMAIELFVRKLWDKLVPVDQAALDSMEELKMNGEYKCVLTQQRNSKFHRKFFALLDVAFDAWEEPEVEYKGIKVKKNKERFRKDVIILCGFYEVIVDISGRIRLEAKSMSFARMDQKDFEILYSSTIDVILAKVLTGYTKADLDEQVARVLRFS